MSGIAGICYTDGRPVDQSVLRRLLDAQSHRGPDGRQIRRETSVGLGHLALHTTPEAVHEAQPRVGRDERLLLTADARIDNRDELISALGCRRDDRPATDAELILRAYRRWGDASPEHLRGAFAFAVWDASKDRLFCARDRMGLRPFHYCWSAPRFVFGSEINAVLAHPAVSHEINDTRVADFLARIHLSKEYTFYDDVLRLPPGHRAVIHREGMHTDAYWTLTLPEERTLGSDAAYAEAFRAVFSSAVEDRLRADGDVGTFLSGGLDSSSVTATAREVSSGPLHTFSAVYEHTPEVDESEYIRAVLDRGDYQSHFVEGTDHDLLKDFPGYLASQQKATLAHTPSLLQVLHRKVQDVGINVVLDGHGGDEVTSHGHGYPGELARTRRWGALIRDLRGSLQGEEISWPEAFIAYWLRYGRLPNRVGRRLLRLLQSVGLSTGEQKTPPQLIGDDFARRTQIADRRRRYRTQAPAAAPTERRCHFRQVSGTIQPGALEELNQVASLRAVEPRLPFWDPRVVEFCLSLPSDVKREQGVGRQIVRSGLSPALPDKIRTRTDKTEFRRGVVYALTHSSFNVQAVIAGMTDALAPYVDMDAVHETVDRFAKHSLDARPADTVAVLQILRLGYFLSSAG
ncbi:asparagine synthase (glutamine-hydrolyzing) [Salinibacter ruber]|uniref:asparagine synthase (glutamine-hydrolyzing) n=1 Tax=Salinibacter ruber TaxID=146919 RepID=UPI002169AF14|nr:asparagine synthase (glutamine-hydrolyzing) [Salinibacter ruber]MCS3697003.1 asparagine synthase (glutamine-hydrolyzing) [Salinibacter ruber]